MCYLMLKLQKIKEAIFISNCLQMKVLLLVMHTSLFSKEDAVKYEVKLFDDKMGTLFSNTEKVKFDDSKKDYEFTISDFEVNFKMMFS